MRMTWTPLLFFLLVATFALSFAQQGPKESTKLSGTYLGQPPPGDKAELFAPGVVSSEYFEHSSPVFTPDLKEIYWSTIIDKNNETVARPIFFMKIVDGVWTRPEVPGFAKKFACSESPFISPDG